MTPQEALAALADNAAARSGVSAERELLMAEARRLVLAAEAAGVDRTTIINCSGLSRRTVYKMFADAGR